MIEVPRLRDRDRWERVVDGWTDNTHDDAVTHTVRIAEPDRTVEVSAAALPSPRDESVQARGRGVAGQGDPPVLAGVHALRRGQNVGGLTRRGSAAAGDGGG